MSDHAKECTVYTDSKTDRWTLQRGVWRGQGHAITRRDPFVLSCWCRFTPGPGAAPLGVDGGGPRWQIAPLETDSRADAIKRGAPTYLVDGGLFSVPFPATVTLVWPDIGPTCAGELEWTITSYGPDGGQGLPTLGISEWHETRWLEDGQRITIPDSVSRIEVPDANYGVALLLFGGTMRTVAPFSPVGRAGSPDLELDFLAPLPAGTDRVPVLLYY